MSTFLILSVLAAAGWLLVTLAARANATKRSDSVAAYSRALDALSPQRRSRTVAPSPRRRPAQAPHARARRLPAPRTSQRARR